jgi:hypothetical protein
MKTLGFIILFLGMSLLSSGMSQAADVDDITRMGEKRANLGATAQTTVDKLSDETKEIVSRYKTELKVVEGLKLYNGLQQKQVANQSEYLADLTDSISKVAVIERQIVPLIVSMINSLENFVELDVPFLLEERRQRIANLREILERSDVTVAEKFRKVLEAYEIEIEYGRTIEASSGKLDQDGRVREVQFLRIGRTSYLYQTVDGEESGVWNETSKSWDVLPNEIYQRQISKGLRLARKEAAPDLIIVPVSAPQEGES